MSEILVFPTEEMPNGILSANDSTTSTELRENSSIISTTLYLSTEQIPIDTSKIFSSCFYPKYSTYEHNIWATVIFLVFIVFGIVASLFGYRFFKAIMFLIGCISGTSVVYCLCMQNAILPQSAIVGISIGSGVLFGLITMLVQYMGLFVAGFNSGLLLCLVSVASADALDYRISSLWTSASLLIAFGVCSALLTLCWKKGMTIFSSSLLGSAMLFSSFDYFIDKLVMTRWLWEKATLKRTINPCPFSWIILCLWPITMLMGLIMQCAFTGKGAYHEKNKNPTASGQNIKPRTQNQRAEMKQQKYRYLYQIRTAHGDVISQNYVQALQRKVIPGMMSSIGETSTLQSDATHLTTLPVDQNTQSQLPSSESTSNTVDSGVAVQFDAGY